MEKVTEKGFTLNDNNGNEHKKALCIFGGGLRAMSGAAAFISAAMATDYNVTHPLTSSSNNSNYDEAIKTLMEKFALVSSNSGGSWFSYAFLLSSTFNGVLKDMTQRYLEDQQHNRSINHITVTASCIRNSKNLKRKM